MRKFKDYLCLLGIHLFKYQDNSHLVGKYWKWNISIYLCENCRKVKTIIKE